MKKLLVTGASGLIGSHLLRQATGRFETVGTFHSFQPQGLPGRLEPLDLAGASSVEKLVSSFRPEIIIHCAALADSDRCQADPALARQTNVDATALVLRLAERGGAKCVLLSTDVVFDGRKGAPYVEEDPPRPLGVYAQTKAEAEQLVRAMSGPWIIARTSLVFGPSPRGNRGLDERLNLAIRSGRPIKLFVDEFRSPISAASLAAALLELAESPHVGIYHLVGPDRLSRYAIGMAIARHHGWPTHTIEPRRVAEVPMDPPRPADLTLDTRKARAVLRTKLSGLTEGLRERP